MESREQQQPVCNSHNQMHVDAKTPIPQSKEIDSSGEEQAPRVRKPYTITKQREKWTEEEHSKFLEALQLYGRAWRRIEEHIGTKTAVQIRSHAQKFFSKVVRESGSNDSTVTLKAIEIPPPRPKRKPLRPYPRKSGNSSSKETPAALKQLERPPLQTHTICEEENRSPTSVLSAVGSEALGSMFSNSQNICSSPAASAAGSNDQDNGGQLTTMTVQEKHKLPRFGPRLDQSSMVIDQCSDMHTSPEAQVPALKLFGKMVVLTDLNKSSAPSNGNAAKAKLTVAVDTKEWQENKAFDLNSKLEMCLQSAAHGVPPRDSTRSAWNAYPGVIPPMFYCFPLVGEDSVEHMFLPPPWSMYGDLPFPFVYPQLQHPQQSPMEAAGEQEMQGEGSWSGSNTASTSGWGLSDQNVDGVDSKKAAKAGGGSSARGFVPYRRCAIESEAQHSATVSDDGEGQAIRLCL
ncbi:unnamed protein product [Musa acuminata subsp. malaccensis]|uniref:(wild Malaysian banana) hypothetical protein n=1 Tax=Musa acuminata subsp. malaccensis TaxID=214687 RepID=A0A804L304_MUSAM|nr:PREDICTED: protein REVEILLE 1-like isoform X1 [Musa acuminata subsp. malaccensis]CAG1863224.1 unnamed protein product [Musa acuminata subsp. malaccensis]